MSDLKIDFKRNHETINNLSKALLLLEIALQFSNDRKFVESTLRVLRTQLRESKACLSDTTMAGEKLLKIISAAEK